MLPACHLDRWPPTSARTAQIETFREREKKERRARPFFLLGRNPEKPPALRHPMGTQISSATGLAALLRYVADGCGAGRDARGVLSVMGL